MRGGRPGRAAFARFLSPVIAVLAAAAVGSALILVSGGSPGEAARVVTDGVLTTPDGIAAVLFNATTLTFTALAVAFAFRAGLFNIGAEGQLLVGSFCATMAALALGEGPRLLVIPLCVAAAAAGGALWGAIPGILRARLGVHEVINTIMMNFIASGLTGYLTVHVFKEPGQMIPQTSAIPEAARLPRLGDVALPGNVLPASSPANTALFLALGACLLAAWILYRTPWGFRIRALGAGERASRTAGMPVAGTIIGAMALAGAFAGLAGANEVLGFRYRFLDNFSSGVGFVGIAVALLGRARIGGLIAAALLFGGLNAGAVEIDLFTEIPRELVLVVQAAILLFVVAAEELTRRLLPGRAA